MAKDRKQTDGPAAAAFTRREVTSRLLAAGAASISLGQLVSTTALAQSPRRGGRLRLAIGGSSGPNDTFDPPKMFQVSDAIRAFQVYNTLTRLTPDLEPEPELATSWEARAGATEWTFELRRGVEFHNGKSFGAEDVIHSFNRVRAPESKSSAKTLLADIEEIKSDGSNRINVKLKAPQAEFPALLSLYQLVITPAGFADFDRPVGTGPFRIKEFRPGITSVMTRNPTYWKEGRPYIDEIESIPLLDPTARINALLSGDVHVIEGIDSKAAEQLQASKAANIVFSKAGRTVVFVMMTDRPPTDDLNLRLALKYGIDRDRLVKSVLRGYGQVGNDHPVPPSHPLYASELPVRPYDPERSKFYLRKAGHSTYNITLHTFAGPYGTLDGALLYKDMIAPAGINVEIRREPTDGYFSNIWMKRAFHASTWLPRPSLDAIFSSMYQSTSAWNETKWNRPDVDRLLVEARGALDIARRKQLYGEAQKLVHEEGGSLLPFFTGVLDASSLKVKGFEAHPAGLLSNYRFAENVWLEG